MIYDPAEVIKFVKLSGQNMEQSGASLFLFWTLALAPSPSQRNAGEPFHLVCKFKFHFNSNSAAYVIKRGEEERRSERERRAVDVIGDYFYAPRRMRMRNN